MKRVDVTLDMLSAVNMVYAVSKTSRKVKSHIENPKLVSRRTEVLLWFIHSQVQDELLTRYSSTGSRTVVRRRDVRTAIRLAVRGFEKCRNKKRSKNSN